MPLVIVEGPPNQEIETKRELVKKITDVILEVYKIEGVAVFIKENSSENIGINGQLMADRDSK